MKAEEYKGNIVRKIVTAMIFNDSICGRIAKKWKPGGLFASDWANQIGGWAISYFLEYDAAPKMTIVNIFEDWATNQDDGVIDATERFMTGLSEDADDVIDVEFLLVVAAEHFNEVLLGRELEAAQADLVDGGSTDALLRLSELPPFEFSPSTFTNLCNDYSVWAAASEKRDAGTPLIRYPGEVGTFFADAFQLGELYAFMGPDKTGKTTFLIDAMYRAIRNRCRVAFFDVGDSDTLEAVRRVASRATRMPEYAGDFPIPTGWGDDRKLITQMQTIQQFDTAKAYRNVRRLARNPDAIRIEDYPNDTMSIDDIAGVLDDWAIDGWVPQVVIIDYADILSSPAGVSDALEKEDRTWKGMRRLSQLKKRPCCLITATQSDAGAYNKGAALLDKSNFSGRKTKMAHPNGIIGLNVTDDERATHQARLNWVVRRKLRNRNRRFVRVAGNFDLENPIIISKW